MQRHWVDPTRPFVAAVAAPAQGFVITSATLTDGTGDTLGDWLAAEARTGTRHLARPAWRARVPSPFDYTAQTRIFIVTDVRREDAGQVAAAYRELFLASGGGALGLFTAIARLKSVHERIAPALEAAGLPLLAQHVDGMDTGTLIDIFRAEEDFVPPRHRCRARRRRRARPLAPPHRLRPRALAAPRPPAQGAQGGLRRCAL